MSSRFTCIALASAMVVFGSPGLLHAQGLTGQHSRTITDTTGAVLLPDVSVSIRNAGTGLVRETVTGTDGV